MLFYVFGFSSSLHCVGGGDKQCSAEQGDVKFSNLRNSCFMGIFMLQYLDKKKKFQIHHLILRNKHGQKAFNEGGCPTD